MLHFALFKHAGTGIIVDTRYIIGECYYSQQGPRLHCCDWKAPRFKGSGHRDSLGASTPSAVAHLLVRTDCPGPHVAEQSE